jgi:hypothetical protein
MAYLMKLLFPNTLDKFEDDFSIKVIEQKPIYLKTINLIINSIINKKKDFTLTANHCFIYNNEQDGEELEKLYGENIYKLSVEESKGLEFELVICYNFFSTSKFQSLWEKIFKNLREELNNSGNSINSSAKIQLGDILYQENMSYLIETLNLRKLTMLSEKVKNGKLVANINRFP